MDPEITEDIIIRRYTEGLKAELKDSVYSGSTLEDYAVEDVSNFLVSLENLIYEKLSEELSERGFKSNADELRKLEQEVTRALVYQKSLNTELRAQLKSAEINLGNRLSFFLGELVDANPTPTDDVEKWAYQDGWNQALDSVVTRINELTE